VVGAGGGEGGGEQGSESGGAARHRVSEGWEAKAVGGVVG